MACVPKWSSYTAKRAFEVVQAQWFPCTCLRLCFLDSGSQWERADLHALNQSTLKGEAMAHPLIGKNGACEVANHLMHLDQDTVVFVWIECQRLHFWIDLTPLFLPVSTDFLRSADKATLERSRPGHVWCHEGNGSGDVPRIEGGVGGAEQFRLRGSGDWGCARHGG